MRRDMDPDEKLSVELTNRQVALISLALGYCALSDIIPAREAMEVTDQIIMAMPKGVQSDIAREYQQWKRNLS